MGTKVSFSLQNVTNKIALHLSAIKRKRRADAFAFLSGQKIGHALNKKEFQRNGPSIDCGPVVRGALR